MDAPFAPCGTCVWDGQVAAGQPGPSRLACQVSGPAGSQGPCWTARTAPTRRPARCVWPAVPPRGGGRSATWPWRAGWLTAIEITLWVYLACRCEGLAALPG